MMIPQELRIILSRLFFAFAISLLLSACKTEDNVGGAGALQEATVSGQTTDTGTGQTVDTGTGQTGSTAAGEITLSWVAPVEREDGTPISMAEIAGYRVHIGPSQGNYTNQIDINDSNTMQATLSNLPAGVYYIVVTAFDTDGRESAFSQEVTRTI